MYTTDDGPGETETCRVVVAEGHEADVANREPHKELQSKLCSLKYIKR
jgi:hypothetical protein